MKKQQKVIENPTIVETYHYGNSTVHIASNCILTEPEEIERATDQMYAAAWAILEAAAARGEEV